MARLGDANASEQPTQDEFAARRVDDWTHRLIDSFLKEPTMHPHRLIQIALLASLLVAAGGFSVAAGSEQRADGAVRLIDTPAEASDQNPAFAPDGSSMIFTRFEEGYNDGPAGIFRLDLTTGDDNRLTRRGDHDNVNLPGTSWNAASNRIAFASDREETDEVWTMAADGSDPTRVTDSTMEGPSIEPSFSPDGEWIVFEAHAFDNEEQGSIWKVRPDGSDLIQLTNGPEEGTDDRQPNWSPKGDRIVFQRRPADEDDWDLYVMTPNGGDVEPVTSGPAGDTDASWSPDGQSIVYSSDDGELEEPSLFLIAVTGGDPVRLTCASGQYDGAPSWSPDGSMVAFESATGTDDAATSLWLIAVPAQAPAAGLSPNPSCLDN
jgi:TolB protein